MDEYIRENDVTDNPFLSIMTDSPYFDIQGIVQHLKEKKFTGNNQYKILHLNIQSLSAKFAQINELLATLTENGLDLDFILLCETFLHDENDNFFYIPGYNLINKKSNKYDQRRRCDVH
jgi:beta-xylosidase